MKVFIVALLVACVAAQDMDLLKLKEKALLKFNRPLHEMTTMKHHKWGYPIERSYIYGDNTEVPTTYSYDDDVKVYGLEEIVQTTLFREYMTLPLFRQYWSYPMFQRYVASIYFQRFWQMPTFQQYFVQPTLFYKYVYPMVIVFKYDTTSYPMTYPTSTYGYDYTWNKNVFPFVYGQNKHFVPTVYNQESMTTAHYYYKILLNKIYNDMYYSTYEKPTYSTYDSIMTPEVYGEDTYKTVPEYYPTTYSYNKYSSWPYTTRYTMPSTYKYNPWGRMMYGMRKPVYTFETEKNYEDVLPYYLNKINKIHHLNKVYDEEIEVPKTLVEPTKFEHIPLTEGKPIVGVKTFDKFEKVIPEIRI